jgi:hypothetical protein
LVHGGSPLAGSFAGIPIIIFGGLEKNFCRGKANGLTIGGIWLGWTTPGRCAQASPENRNQQPRTGNGAGAIQGQMSSYAPNTSNDIEYSAAIQVGAKPDPDAEEARWTFALTVFFRVVALLWIIEGLEQWRRILTSTGGSFEDLRTAAAAAVIFFAVLDLVAAVGLWMIAPWGGVVWLLTLMAQIYVCVIKPNFFSGGGVLVKGVDGFLLALYLFLSWRANRESGETGALDKMVDRAFAWLRDGFWARGRSWAHGKVKKSRSVE